MSEPERRAALLACVWTIDQSHDGYRGDLHDSSAFSNVLDIRPHRPLPLLAVTQYVSKYDFWEVKTVQRSTTPVDSCETRSKPKREPHDVGACTPTARPLPWPPRDPPGADATRLRMAACAPLGALDRTAPQPRAPRAHPAAPNAPPTRRPPFTAQPCVGGMWGGGRSGRGVDASPLPAPVATSRATTRARPSPSSCTTHRSCSPVPPSSPHVRSQPTKTNHLNHA